MDNMRMPKVFIGSSTKGLSAASAIQSNLRHVCESTLWTQGVFPLGKFTLEALEKQIPESDFAVLVLTPDDKLKTEEEDGKAPRQNVVLELGICIGALGLERTFAVCESSKMILPSDIDGVTRVEYRSPVDGNLQSALGHACNEIERAVKRLGVRTIHGDSTKLYTEYLGVSHSASTIIIGHCNKSKRLAQLGIQSPGSTLIHYIVDHLGLAAPRSQFVEAGSHLDRRQFDGVNTAFIIDSPQFNPYALKVMKNRGLYVTGGRIFHEIQRTAAGVQIQTITVDGRRYQTDKYAGTHPAEVFGAFNDYLVVMRLPGDVLAVEGLCSLPDAAGERTVWLVFGITLKGSHAGVYLLREENLTKFERHLHAQGAVLPKYFEALFLIPDSKERVEGFEDSTLVHFSELRSKKEHFGAVDPPPAGLAKYFHGDTDAAGLPDIPITSVHIDPIAACNFGCPSCIEKSLRSQNICLSTPRLCRILTDLHQLGCRDVRFYGGEPTMHPDFDLVLKLGSCLGFHMLLVTNGSLLNEERIKGAVKASRSLHVRVSLDGNSQKTHELHHGLPSGRFDFQALKNVLVEMIKDGVSISLSYLLTKESLDELREACEFWHGVGASSLHPRLVMRENGAWPEDVGSWTGFKTVQHVLRDYGSWVVVPPWFGKWVADGSPPPLKNQFEKCYSGYYRIGVSPYREEGADLPEVPLSRLPSGKIFVTDKAWISHCLYRRNDARFGCEYPSDLSMWCRKDRIEKLATIRPDTGLCRGIVCSRAPSNEMLRCRSEGN